MRSGPWIRTVQGVSITVADPFTVPTRYWHALDDGRVQCDVCPRACKLRDGQQGVCFVRGRSAANVDLKAFTQDFYRHTCGGDLGAVLDSLVYLRSTDVWFEVTTLLIPGHNDSDDEIDQMTKWVVANLGPDVPMHFTAFHPDYRMLDAPPTPLATLSRAREMALANGVHHAYTGNVHDQGGQSTTCTGCGSVVIERDWYRLGAYRLDDQSGCTMCGTVLAGVFDGGPGDWGPRRRPVSIHRRDRQVRT